MTELGNFDATEHDYMLYKWLLNHINDKQANLIENNFTSHVCDEFELSHTTVATASNPVKKEEFNANDIITE